MKIQTVCGGRLHTHKYPALAEPLPINQLDGHHELMGIMSC